METKLKISGKEKNTQVITWMDNEYLEELRLEALQIQAEESYVVQNQQLIFDECE